LPDRQVAAIEQTRIEELEEQPPVAAIVVKSTSGGSPRSGALIAALQPLQPWAD
jgi:hypothetical protein